MLKQIDRWDLVEEERVLTIEEGAERDTSVRELWKLHSMEEV